MNSTIYEHQELPALKFDPNRKRVKQCPCGEPNTTHFAPYVGYDDKGYCHKCYRKFLPDLNIPDNYNKKQFIGINPKLIAPPKPIDYIPNELYQKQFNNGKHLFKQNNFIMWLKNKNRGEFAFDDATVDKLIDSYLLGNSSISKYSGWILFPYIDFMGRICDIKAMDYDRVTGKRIKEPDSRCKFMGKEILNNWNANLTKCFYGEHLLRGNTKPVYIFESEATATYAAAFFPDCVCLATGGINGCKWTEKSKINVLTGHKVILYPDIDAHEDWEIKAQILRDFGLDVKVSQFIVEIAKSYAIKQRIDYSELVAQKFDLRDILKFKSLTEYHNTAQVIVPEINHLQRLKEQAIQQYNKYFSGKRLLETKKSYLESWFEDMKSFFNELGITKEQFLAY